MTKEVKYGVISDIHEDPKIIVPALKVLKAFGAKKLLVNGDIGVASGDLESNQRYTGFILNEVARSGMEAFVQPGSHETVFGYWPVVDYFAQKHGNIIDVTKPKNQKIEQDGHTLVFLPGSDFSCGGEFTIGNNMPTCYYLARSKEKNLVLPDGTLHKIGVDSSLIMCENVKEVASSLSGMQRIDNTATFETFRYSNMEDLRGYVKNPERTVVVCHVPRKFSGLETCVDVAEFGEVTEDFLLNNSNITKGSVFPIQVAVNIAKAGGPVEIKKTNRGNEKLAKLYEELGVTKAVSGHFHESSHRANDRQSNHVEEGQYTKELFWNSGHLDKGYTGILTVRGEEVSYQNICLSDYIK